ncbi:MAG: hypothetical protein AB7O04_09930 [Hyphomonadaceae bacterium]
MSESDPLLAYEVRPAGGKWRLVYNGGVLFEFDTKQDALGRLDDVAFAGSRLGKNVEIRIYDEDGALAERYSRFDYEI